MGTRSAHGRDLFIGALALLCWLATGLPAAAGVWDLDGDAQFSDGTPAAGATVYLRTPSSTLYSTVADGNGQYALLVDEPGTSGQADLWAVAGTCDGTVLSVMDRDITATLTVPGTIQACTPE